jgi:hypothetical protein
VNIEVKLFLLEGNCFVETGRRNEVLSYKYFALMCVVSLDIILFHSVFPGIYLARNFPVTNRKVLNPTIHGILICEEYFNGPLVKQKNKESERNKERRGNIKEE